MEIGEEETFHISDERISHLIFREEPAEVIFPRYKSKYSAKVREDVKKNKKCHQSMGLPADFYMKLPTEYLRKQTHIIRRPDVDHCEPGHNVGPKSIVPKHDDWKKEKRPDKTDKDHLKGNMTKVMNAVPKTGPSRYYDQATDKRYHNCILTMPKFVHSKKFGKVPKYIDMFKKEEQNKLEAKKKEDEWRRAASEIKELSQEERKELLDGLKRRWEEMQKEFQLLPMLNDTAHQIKRKLKLEKELTALEQEIDHIERNQLIFIVEPFQEATKRCKTSFL